MIDAPAKPPVDDEDGDEPKPAANEFQYGRQRPRNLVAVFAVVLILALLALFGIVKAVMSDSEDPDKIVFPEHMTKSLADEQPTDHSAPRSATTAAPATVPYQAPGGEGALSDDMQSAPAPDNTQTESTLDLNEPSTPPSASEAVPAAPMATPPQTPSQTVPQTPSSNGDQKTDEKKSEVAPQSMIKWDQYPVQKASLPAQPVKVHGPQIVIVIDDMGLNHRNSQAVVAMKAALTLSYLPYAENLQRQADAARQNGHELIVHMPMEPDNLKQHNPGPNALLTANSAEENIRRFDKNMNSFTGYIGFNNHMGSRMTANATAMRPILQALKQRGLWFLDSRTIGNSVAGKLAEDIGIPYVVRDVFLDNVETVPAVLRQLHQVEAIAKKRGYAVAIGHPHDATIAALKQWLPQVTAQGYQVVPLSTVIAERYPSAAVPHYAQLNRAKTPTEAVIEPAAGPVTGGMTIPAFGLHAAVAKPCAVETR